MTKLLYVEASPSKARSTTIRVAASFLDAYRAATPAGDIDRLDVWATDFPEFDDAMIEAKFAVLRKQAPTPEQAARWRTAVAVAKRFNAADIYVFAVPMWNFGLPYRLKHFIDIATLAGENWLWSKETGYQGLLRNKRAVLIYSSANAYPLLPYEDASDFVKPHLRRWLAFLGIDDIHEVNAAPTLTTREAKEKTIQAAEKAAGALAIGLAQRT